MAEGPSQSVDERETELFSVVAQRMKSARVRAGLSPAELADKIGVKKPYIFELERGTGNPTLKTLNKVAVALDVDPGDFFPQSTHPALDQPHVNLLLAACEKLAAMLASRRTQEDEAQQRESGAVETLRHALRQLVPLREIDKSPVGAGTLPSRHDRPAEGGNPHIGKL